MYNVEMVYAPWNRLKNYEVHFRGLIGSIEGPRRILDLLGVHLYVHRVPWYVFCCLECKIIANMANFPCGANKDSQTSAWWGLSGLLNTFQEELFLRTERMGGISARPPFIVVREYLQYSFLTGVLPWMKKVRIQNHSSLKRHHNFLWNSKTWKFAI